MTKQPVTLRRVRRHVSGCVRCCAFKRYRAGCLLAGMMSTGPTGDRAVENKGFVTHYQGECDQTWQTPRELFEDLDLRFNFTLDGAALPETTLLEKYSTSSNPLSWSGERVFCNPPWSDIASFVELAPHAKCAVLLVPARVNSKWFHRALELGAKPEFLLGRPRFHKRGVEGSGNPFDCILLVFGEPYE